MDLLKLMQAANKAVEQVRSSGEPYLLVCNTYRFRAHSMFDAELYRDKTEVEKWKKRDPIPKFRKYLLKENLISEAKVQELEKRLNTEIQKAVDFAEAGTWEAKEELTRFVYSENPVS